VKKVMQRNTQRILCSSHWLAKVHISGGICVAILSRFIFKIILPKVF
jgi:hypothetical protein